jgi:hypothetical protein
VPAQAHWRASRTHVRAEMSWLMPPRFVVLMRVAAASALGALAAVIAVGVPRTIDYPRLVDAIVVAVTALCVLGVAMVTSDLEDARQTHQHQPRPDDRRRPPPGVPQEAGSPTPTAGSRALLPPAFLGATAGAPSPLTAVGRSQPPDGRSETAGGGLSWHEAAARGVAGRAEASAQNSLPAPVPGGAQPGPSRSAHVEIALESVGNAGDVRQIVQCPRCGGFEVQVHRVRQGCTFECGGCGHQWHWRQGDPWPVTVVRPRLTRSRPGEPGSGASSVWRMNS